MDLPNLWERVLSTMQRQIQSSEVDVWLRPARPTHYDGSTLELEVPNFVYRDWILENYRDKQDLLIPEIERALGHRVELSFVFRDDHPSQEAPTPFPKPVGTGKETRGVGVNPYQNFSNFIVGECNKFAHAAARAVAEHPARAYNPLYIYGSSGLGKTHLLHGIANEILKRDPEARVVYVTCEEFLNELVNAVRTNRTEEFRSKYRKNATALIIDDIQILSNKERTQEEFFHTFNALQSSQRQIVMTSDMMPKDITKLEPRLRTRFEGGLLADMQAPDRETLLAILGQKTEVLKIHIPFDLADVIANQVSGNIRELEGLLNRLAALNSFYNEPLTLEFARKRLPNLFTSITVQVTVAAIIEAVAKFHNLRSADLTGDRRTRTLTHPRQIAMYLARKNTSLSFPELGREFGGRDHSTIQHGVHKIEEELLENHDLSYKIRLIEQSLGLHPNK